ncbi:hypothetical protein FRC0337_01966 [Corynebacterium diphtheriae]|nr:hypothetical protein BKD75_10560 [Corynebacterium diphtheriae]CAB0566687.1 hypothetical protein CIP107523_01920 [Corynebacterium diphtheriae]CAB0568542.1 hypothetical protein CIP107529_02044 [Corynebacterium diphtheriae]CAB0859524.1 hypothetical protein FRC0337_01966 [Corynebacterium diphtheriae]CAB0916310.1 hypothetical protein FRC0424_01939 [Corynebacterium diphtheriae]
MELVELPGLPRGDFLSDRIGDRAHGIWRHVHADGGSQMMFDVTHGHPTGIQAHDHAIDIR